MTATRRIVVCGSRGYSDSEWVKHVIRMFFPAEHVFVVGGAKGPDRWAEDEALVHGFGVEVFKADWKRYGKWAGYKRNIEMLDTRPEMVVAFWDGKSKGTAHTIREAVRRGIKVVIWDKKRRKHSADYYGF